LKQAEHTQISTHLRFRHVYQQIITYKGATRIS